MAMVKAPPPKGDTAKEQGGEPTEQLFWAAAGKSHSSSDERIIEYGFIMVLSKGRGYFLMIFQMSGLPPATTRNRYRPAGTGERSSVAVAEDSLQAMTSEPEEVNSEMSIGRLPVVPDVRTESIPLVGLGPTVKVRPPDT